MSTNDLDNPFRKEPDWRKLIVFNGPPESGKDTAAETVRSFVQVNAPYMMPRHMKFAEPLKKAAHSLYGAFHSWDFYDSREGRDQKNVPNGDFLGLSPREAYIAMHQEYLDKMHGPKSLGFILKKRMIRENSTQLFVLSDSGFVDELEPIIDLIGQRGTMIVELHAVGCSYEGDSRNYIGDTAQKRWPMISVKKLSNVIGTKDDLAMFKMLCQGLTKNFLRIEEKDG